jgi:hypothetical protein
MEQFLEDLRELLNANRATILRSADENNRLVVSLLNSNGSFDEVEFEEEIGPFEILHELYDELAKKD